MPANYLLRINDKDEISVRLVGIIDERKCEALVNDPDAPKKVATAENFDINSESPFNKRFVVVVNSKEVALPGVSAEELKTMSVPFLFISAVVTRMTFNTGNKVLDCKDKNKYQFIPISK